MIAQPTPSSTVQDDADSAALHARLDHLFRKQVNEGDDGWASLQLRRHVEAYRRMNREQAA